MTDFIKFIHHFVSITEVSVPYFTRHMSMMFLFMFFFFIFLEFICFFSLLLWHFMQISIFSPVLIPFLFSFFIFVDRFHFFIFLFLFFVLFAVCPVSFHGCVTLSLFAGRASWSWTHWNCRTTTTSADSSESEFHLRTHRGQKTNQTHIYQ